MDDQEVVEIGCDGGCGWDVLLDDLIGCWGCYGLFCVVCHPKHKCTVQDWISVQQWFNSIADGDIH